MQKGVGNILLSGFILGKLKGAKSGVRTSPTPHPIEMSAHDLPKSTKNDPNNGLNRSNQGPLQDREQYTAEKAVFSSPPDLASLSVLLSMLSPSDPSLSSSSAGKPSQLPSESSPSEYDIL